MRYILSSSQKGHVHKPSRADHNQDNIAFIKKCILDNQRVVATCNENTAKPEPPSNPITVSSYKALIERKQHSVGAVKKAPSSANKQVTALIG